MRRDQRRHRHLRPAAADRDHDRHRRDLLRRRAAAAARSRAARSTTTLADALTGQLFGVLPGEPRRAGGRRCSSIWVPFSRSVIGRAAYAVGSSETAAYMSGVPIRRAKFVAYTLAGLLAVDRRPVPDLLHLHRRGGLASGNTYTLFSIAAVVLGGVSLFGGTRQRDRRDLRRAGVPHHRRPAVRVRLRSAVAAAVPGRRAAARGLASARSACSACATGWSGSDERRHRTPAAHPAARIAAPPRSRGRDGVRLHRAAAAARQPLFAQLPVAGIPAAAAQGRARSSASSPPA